MKKSEITLNEWKSLYELSLKFKALACWEWMEDSDIFGVQNPADGEIGYCCVLGSLGEVFALNVYTGTEGLEIYQKMQRGEFYSTPMDIYFVQKCLMASFDNKKDLDKKDLNIIEELGLKFRGKHAWPMFRNYHPGCVPWFLTKEEVIFLTVALEQAIIVAERFKENPDLLTPAKKGTYFVRVPEKKENKLIWKDKWLKPVPLKKEEKILPFVDEERLKKIKKEVKKGQNIWEIDYFYSPDPVYDKRGERPYYPLTFLCIDGRSHMPLSTDILKNTEIGDFRENFLYLIESLKFMPGIIVTTREDVKELFEPVAKALGIRIEIVEYIKAMEQLQEMMMGFL
jgi:hypothetical protein